MKYAEVYVDAPLDDTYTYEIPKDMIVEMGFRVEVSLRRRLVRGFVKRVHNEKPSFKVVSIGKVIDSEAIFDERLLKLTGVISFDYLATIGEMLSLALPSGKSGKRGYKIPYKKNKVVDVELSEDQQSVVNSILDAESKGQLQHLLYGITGSGKTEVYIELAKKSIANEKSVLYLVPEITLSSQIERIMPDFE